MIKPLKAAGSLCLIEPYFYIAEYPTHACHCIVRQLCLLSESRQPTYFNVKKVTGPDNIPGGLFLLTLIFRSKYTFEI